MTPPRVSIVIPLFENRDTVSELLRRIAASLAGVDFEVVAVDDRGGDGSGEALRSEAELGGIEFTLLRHPRNLGQNTAVLTGLAAARGETIVVMDADLQDPPEVIPLLLEPLAGGRWEMAFGLREGRWAGAFQILASRLFKALLFSLLGSPLPVRVGLFVAMTRSVRDRLLARARPGQYLVGHLAALHRPAAIVPFPRVPRPGGGSSYSWIQRARLAAGALHWAWSHRVRPRVPVQAALCAGIASMVAFLLLSGQPFGLQDDGFRYLLSRTWAHEGALFAHFDLLYPPGAHVWYGSWMRLLGDHVWVLRLGQSLLVGLTVLLVVPPLRRHAGPAVAWSSGLLLGAIGTGWGKMAAMGAVAAALLSMDTLRHRGPAWFALLGAGAGLLLGWREDAAVLLAAVTLASLLLARRGWRTWGVTALGAAAGFGVWPAIFALAGEGTPFISHELHRLWLLVDRLTPAGRTRAAWPVPAHIASPRDAVAAAMPLLQYFPLSIYLALFGAFFVSRMRRRPLPPVVATAALLGVLFTPQFLWEFPDLYHLRSHLAVTVITLAAASGALGKSRRRTAAAALAVAALTAVAMIAWQHHVEKPELYPVDPGRAIGARLETGAPPWAPLSAGPGQTMIALPWCPGWYAVEAAPPGTRILSAMPRHLRQRNTLARLAHDLSRSSNRYVIVQGSPEALAPPLRRIVLEQYRPAGSWCGFDLLVRPQDD